MDEIETTIYTQDEVRIHIDSWDDGGVLLGLRNNSAGMHCVLTRDEAKQMLRGLQAILGRDVVLV